MDGHAMPGNGTDDSVRPSALVAENMIHVEQASYMGRNGGPFVVSFWKKNLCLCLKCVPAALSLRKLHTRGRLANYSQLVHIFTIYRYIDDRDIRNFQTSEHYQC
jgi:hypothetical protein